ncbi:phage tail protein [Pontimicrobium sp. MEBiC06410]
MAKYFPPVGFYFSVEFSLGSDENTKDNQFQSVSGLSIDLETEEIAEGGENRFKYKLPVKTKYPNLVLKRGMIVDSKVIDWCREALENYNFEPLDIMVNLLVKEGDITTSATAKPLRSWNIKNAFPVKWNVSDFNAEENKFVIETLELSYNYFEIL